MRNQPFSTLPVPIFRQCCINNQNIHNTNNHMCLSCVRDDMVTSSKAQNWIKDKKHHELPRVFSAFRYILDTWKTIQPICVK